VYDESDSGYGVFPETISVFIQMFEGIQYRTAENWADHVQVREYAHRPIRYLEIGTFYGANLLSVARTYASHPDSVLYCIDPWEDYEDYPEYKDEQPTIYQTFLKNVASSGVSNQLVINRGYSHEVLPTLPDDCFDIIYVDGNHEPEYVLEDAVLSFRKLKVGGILIFDDYGWQGPDMTQRGIDGFLNGFHKRICRLGIKDSQVFVRKER
jgi:predicted O-methyltransferase YrrM